MRKSIYMISIQSDVLMSGFGSDWVAKQKTDSLQLRVPKELKRQLAMDAAKDGVTIRSIILGALAKAGYTVAKDEMRDKRKGRS